MDIHLSSSNWGNFYTTLGSQYTNEYHDPLLFGMFFVCFPGEFYEQKVLSRGHVKINFK